MINKRRGMSLVEVIVATLVFLIAFTGVCTTYLLSRKGEVRQREYLKIESMCKDIDLYSDRLGRGWVNSYFNITLDTALSSHTIYLDTKLKITEEASAYYKIIVEYSDYSDYFDSEKYPNGSPTDLEMRLNVINIYDDYYIIKDLVYGSRDNRYGK